MSRKNCMVAQSGGPTAAINASLSGVIQKVLDTNSYQTVFGSLHGITGILNNNILNLNKLFKDNPNNQHRLTYSPAMFLGSCRYKLPEMNSNISIYQKIFEKFQELDIDAFFYIGGNDSMDTVLKLSTYAKEINSDIKIIGIPKTIDNDLQVIDHTPGFGSAAKYIATSIMEIAYDAYIYTPKSVTIVEIMGRDTGWLAGASALARNHFSGAPHLIYLPEKPFEKTQFLRDLQVQLQIHSNVVVAVSEGIRDKNGVFISAGENKLDTFGHSQLGGAGKYLESFVKANMDVKVRSIELNVLQRCAAHLTSRTDIQEAVTLGSTAVDLSLENKTGCMVTLIRTSNAPYTVEFGYQNIQDIANHVKYVPDSFINDSGNDITADFLTYLSPLIQGETTPCSLHGLPEYMDISHLLQVK